MEMQRYKKKGDINLKRKKKAISWKSMKGKLKFPSDFWPNARIRELSGVTKRVDERVDERVLRWFDHNEKTGNGRNAIRVYVGECIGSRYVGRSQKRWTDSVNDCLKKRIKMKIFAKREI